MGRYDRGLFTWEKIKIKSSSEDENKRIITITPYGKKYEELCEAILWDTYI